jgi:hypothetical protein
MVADPALRERECLLNLLTGNLRERAVAAKRVSVNKRMAGFISQNKGEGKKDERSVERGEGESESESKGDQGPLKAPRGANCQFVGVLCSTTLSTK